MAPAIDRLEAPPSPQAGGGGKGAASRKAASAAGGCPLFLPSRLREGPGEGLSAQRVSTGLPPAHQQAPSQPLPQAGEGNRAACNRPTGSAAVPAGRGRRQRSRIAQSRFGGGRVPPFPPLPLAGGAGGGAFSAMGLCPVSIGAAAGPHPASPASGGGGSSRWQSTGRKRGLPQAGEGGRHKAVASRKAALVAGGPPLLLPSRLREESGEGLSARRVFAGASTGAAAGPHPASPASGGGGSSRWQSRTTGSAALPASGGRRQGRPHRAKPLWRPEGSPFSSLPARPESCPFPPLPLAGGVGGGPIGATGLCRVSTGVAAGPHPASPASGGEGSGRGNRLAGSATLLASGGRRGA